MWDQKFTAIAISVSLETLKRPAPTLSLGVTLYLHLRSTLLLLQNYFIFQRTILQNKQICISFSKVKLLFAEYDSNLQCNNLELNFQFVLLAK